MHTHVGDGLGVRLSPERSSTGADGGAAAAHDDVTKQTETEFGRRWRILRRFKDSQLLWIGTRTTATEFGRW